MDSSTIICTTGSFMTLPLVAPVKALDHVAGVEWEQASLKRRQQLRTGDEPERADADVLQKVTPRYFFHSSSIRPG
jgi:hypothetical protein